MKISTLLVVSLIVALSLCTTAECKKKEKNTQNYYEKLGVKQDATLREIKKAYFQLAVVYHPDKTQMADKELAEKKFIEISHAYEILADTDKRAKYDRLLQFGVTEYKENYQAPEKRKTEDQEEEEEETTQETYNFKDAYKMYQEFYAKERELEDSSATRLLIPFVIVAVSVFGYFVWKQKTSARKRDEKEQKRIDRIKKEQQQEERRKALNEKQKQERDQQHQHVEQEWNKQEEDLSVPEEELIAHPKKDNTPGTELHCALCKKSFKTDSQWKNHEQSKKHQQAMNDLNKFVKQASSQASDEKESKPKVDSKAARRMKKKQMIDDMYDEYAQTND